MKRLLLAGALMLTHCVDQLPDPTQSPAYNPHPELHCSSLKQGTGWTWNPGTPGTWTKYHGKVIVGYSQTLGAVIWTTADCAS